MKTINIEIEGTSPLLITRINTEEKNENKKEKARQISRKWYKENKEKKAEYMREYYKAHPEYKVNNRIRTQKWRERNRIKYNKLQRKVMRARLNTKNPRINDEELEKD